MSGIRLKGTGSALPRQVVTNRDLQRIVETDDAWIVSRTGIRERRKCRDETQSSLAEAAARAGSLREHKAVRRGILTLTILICMSTMFLKQHSAVDVVCGLILSVVLDLLVRRWNPGLGLLRLVVRPRAGGRTVMET